MTQQRRNNHRNVAMAEGDGGFNRADQRADLLFRQARGQLEPDPKRTHWDQFVNRA